MADIFISHSKLDMPFTRYLRTQLENQGFTVWMDEAQLTPSQHWWKSIEENLTFCLAFVIIMSPQGKESDWIEREILLAERLHKPIFPVLMEGEGWNRLANIQYADMRSGVDTPLPTRFLEGLRGTIGSSATAPVAASSVSTAPLAPPTRKPQRTIVFGGALIAALLFILIIGRLFSNSSAAASNATATAIKATERESILRNAYNQTEKAPPVLQECPSAAWFFTFADGNSESLCPTAAARFVSASRQLFQHGIMLRYSIAYDVYEKTEVSNRIYVLYQDTPQRFEIYEDTFQPGDILSDSSLNPPETNYQPEGSLGKVWRQQPGVSSKLGWATTHENAIGGRFQFPSGSMCNCVRVYVADGGGDVIDLAQGLTNGTATVAGGSWAFVGTYPS